MLQIDGVHAGFRKRLLIEERDVLAEVNRADIGLPERFFHVCDAVRQRNRHAGCAAAEEHRTAQHLQRGGQLYARHMQASVEHAADQLRDSLADHNRMDLAGIVIPPGRERVKAVLVQIHRAGSGDGELMLRLGVAPVGIFAASAAGDVSGERRDGQRHHEHQRKQHGKESFFHWITAFQFAFSVMEELVYIIQTYRARVNFIDKTIKQQEIQPVSCCFISVCRYSGSR